MAKIVTPLSDTLLKNLKAKDKNYTKTDGNGLRMLVKTNGTKLWEFEYTSPTLQKRRKTSFGTYPQTTLAMARNKREENIRLIRSGIDPLEQKKIELTIIQEENEIKTNTFKKIALEWHDKYANQVSENYHFKLLRALELYIFPEIAKKPITEVTRKDIIKIIQTLQNKNLFETSNRTLMILNKIYMYAVTLEYVPHNIIADIDKKVLLGKIEKVHYPTLEKPEEIRGLLLSIDEYQGEISTQFALKLLPYIFVRSFNLRNMTWDEINFKNKEWTIPANKMKIKKEFILPLPEQAMKILKDLKKIQTSDSKYVFVGIRSIHTPISDNTLISALRRMGYTKEQFVPHSFRNVFSTIAHDNMHIHGFNSEIIEALLAHQETNKVKATYNRATYKEQMRKLIQWYANWLDDLKK